MGLGAGVEMTDPPSPPAELWERQSEEVRLRAEQVRVLFQQQPIVVATNIAIGALVSVVLGIEGGWPSALV